MSDARTRQAERSDDSRDRARAMRERIRAGLLVPGYTSVKRTPCKHPGAPGAVVRMCSQCGGKRSKPYDPWDLVMLMAFCGNEPARELVGMTSGGNGRVYWRDTSMGVSLGAPDFLFDAGPTHLEDSLKHLQRIASRLPPARVEVDCSKCKGPTYPATVNACPWCRGSRKVHHDTPAERYLLVVAAHAVGLECWGRSCQCQTHNTAFHSGQCSSRLCALFHSGQCSSRLCALDACAEWIACPCPEHKLAWDRSLPRPVNPDWVPTSFERAENPQHAIQAAAKILGPDRVRAVAAKAVLRTIR